MIFLILILIQILFAFKKLNINHPHSALYKNYIIFNQNEDIAYSHLQNQTQYSIISQNMTDFCLQNHFLAVWNRELIIIYTLYENQNESTIRKAEAKNIRNEDFTNITITSSYFVAQYQNESLYVLNILTQKVKILNQTFVEPKNKSHQSIVVYQYDSNLTFTYFDADDKYHIIYLSEHINQLDEKVLFSTQNGVFSTQYWNNGTAVFMNSHWINYTLPTKVLSWYRDDTKIRIKYLFSIQDAYVFAIFTNKGICYQYYSKSLQINYQNILCMKMEDEFYQIHDVNFKYRLQILLKHNQTDELAIDYYNQCLLFSTIPIEKSCTLCLNDNCLSECHYIKSYQCNENYRIRASLPFLLISICIIFIFVSFIIQICKVLTIFIQLFCLFTCSLFNRVPKYIILKFRRLKIKLRHRMLPLPLSNPQTCPICLGDVLDATFFPCNRHAACFDCFTQYEATQGNQQIKCPYRDE
ncbi:unnamed protein product [Paramecium octaurelia]|uniref:RING-type domain-containing protein n=1 Tax=Paramecium octaurelia TaxID=43137 RepID=A0A8S1XVT7_PAROT|nr:unnamed protein product [Paramecium octaurelia]